MPKTIRAGLPDAAVKERTPRVERANVNSSCMRPYERLLINLAAGDLLKQSASFDLPVALGVLAGSGQLAPEKLGQCAIIGELTLEGMMRRHQLDTLFERFATRPRKLLPLTCRSAIVFLIDLGFAGPTSFVVC